ncbi:glucodextranase DOMON-like domain-containing protein [Thermosipho atlanticus]|uniref:Pullulanase /alpha-amylase n=1 Tax=Thermosipho atlanticus DSM 15807 TaxID=1123380 RepID=A0A1M5T4X9_9BACT|nr:glucodextranase DOMON-like domain-containing protein [Thermosipho atlanticus]SHH45807.1 pullulanase /alpha-amylase [Thermosipho atlanticus DSM 15807]
MKKLIVFYLLLIAFLVFSAVYVENGKVVFTFKEALDAKVVYLAGNFNNWNPTELAMKKEGNLWKITLELKPGTYQYKYVIEGTNWKEDPEAPGYVDDGFGGYNGIFSLIEKNGELEVVGAGNKKTEEKTSEIEINTAFDPGKFFIDEEGFVVIRFFAKDAEYVTIAGNFNNWDMEANECYDIGDGWWEAVLELDEGAYEYKFVVNGEKWITDPNAPAYVDDGFGGKNGYFEVYKENGELKVGIKDVEKENEKKAYPLDVAIIWHNHQPLYKIPGSNEYMMPWVRAHGVNDYPYMADLVENYLENGKVTFNIVPSLLLQLQDYLKGSLDEYQRLSLKQESELTKEERQFILDHFFDINPQFVNGHKRYKELMELKTSGAEFTDQDLLDLKVCWNLYWINIDYINSDKRLKSLLDKEHYTRDDLLYVLDFHKKLLSSVIDKYKKLWDEGKIEITTTPFYHPILPILVDKGWIEDANGQIKEGLEYFKQIFGKRPDGMWPSEQAVSQEVAKLFAENNVKWIVTDKQILQKSGINTGEIENILRPYKVKTEAGEIVVFFRDTDLSNRISFKYSQMKAEDAVNDLLNTLHEYQKLNTSGDLIITIALDGENAWEHYPNNGNDFRKLLYKKLSEDPLINLVTPSQYLKEHKVTNELTTLAKGSWAGGSLDTWIGEKEENEAWDRLSKAREILLSKVDIQKNNLARHVLYAAEGSDWFWWYGADQDAGNNEVLFDQQFKNLLIKMYKLARYKEIPSYLYIPNKKPAPPTTGVIKKIEYILNGKLDEVEKTTAIFDDTLDENILQEVIVGRGNTGLYIGVKLDKNAKEYLGEDIKIEIYADSPTAKKFNAKTYYSNEKVTPLGFALSHRFVINLKTWQKRPKVSFYKASGTDRWILTTAKIKGSIDEIVEFEIPYDVLNVKSGQEFNIAVVISKDRKDVDFAPNNGPINVILPATITGDVVKVFKDPVGDEYGPGTYVYPKDPAFKPYKGLFDMTDVVVLENEEAYIFQIKFVEMTNPWGAPKGFSHQLINIYLDTKQGGRTDTYNEGARVQFDENHPWDYFIKVAGWPSYGQFFATSDGDEIADAVRVEADTGEKTINIIVYKKYLEVSNGIYAYILVGSQDGYGPDNFRPVTPEPGQWTLGGYPTDSDDMAPYVVDILVPEGYNQKTILSSYVPGSKYATILPVKIK